MLVPKQIGAEIDGIGYFRVRLETGSSDIALAAMVSL